MDSHGACAQCCFCPAAVPLATFTVQFRDRAREECSAAHRCQQVCGDSCAHREGDFVAAVMCWQLHGSPGQWGVSGRAHSSSRGRAPRLPEFSSVGEPPQTSAYSAGVYWALPCLIVCLLLWEHTMVWGLVSLLLPEAPPEWFPGPLSRAVCPAPRTLMTGTPFRGRPPISGCLI